MWVLGQREYYRGFPRKGKKGKGKRGLRRLGPTKEGGEWSKKNSYSVKTGKGGVGPATKEA